MRQHRLVVPFQLIAAFLAVLFMAVVSPKASTDVIFNSEPETSKKSIDVIVTGQTVSSDQMEDWKAKRDKYIKCGLCGNAQPYPENLKD